MMLKHKKKKKNSITGIFQSICVHIRKACLKDNLKEKSKKF